MCVNLWVPLVICRFLDLVHCYLGKNCSFKNKMKRNPFNKKRKPPKKNERWSRKVLFYFGVRGGIFFFFFLIQLIFVVLFLFFFACEVAFYIKKKISCYLAPGGEGVILAVIENCFSFSLPEYLACILVKGKYLITLIVFQNPKLYTT